MAFIRVLTWYAKWILGNGSKYATKYFPLVGRLNYFIIPDNAHIKNLEIRNTEYENWRAHIKMKKEEKMEFIFSHPKTKMKLHICVVRSIFMNQKSLFFKVFLIFTPITRVKSSTFFIKETLEMMFLAKVYAAKRAQTLR